MVAENISMNPFKLTTVGSTLLDSSDFFDDGARSRESLQHVCVSHLQNNNTAWADLPWQETAQCRINLICDLGPAPQPQISQVKYSSSS